MKSLVFGIDVSQNTLDVAYCLEEDPIFVGQFPNSEPGLDYWPHTGR